MTEIKPNLPAETCGTDVTRFNALKHGILSRYTVLPWEDADEYRDLGCCADGRARAARTNGRTSRRGIGLHLMAQASPSLSGGSCPPARPGKYIRVLQEIVKVALVHLDVTKESERVIDAIRATAANTETEIADVQEDETMSRRVLRLTWLRSATMPTRRRSQLFGRIHSVVGRRAGIVIPMVRARMKSRFAPEVDSLHRFIEQKVLPCLETRRKELAQIAL